MFGGNFGPHVKSRLNPMGFHPKRSELAEMRGPGEKGRKAFLDYVLTQLKKFVANPDDPFEGFFVRAVPTMNADGSESIKLKVKFDLDPYTILADSSYPSSWDNDNLESGSSTFSFRQRGLDLKEKWIGLNYPEDQGGYEDPRCVFQGGNGDSTVNEPAKISEFLLGQMFTPHGLPIYAQEVYKERVQVYYARNYPRTHSKRFRERYHIESYDDSTDGCSTGLLGNPGIHSLGVHRLENDLYSPFFLRKFSWRGGDMSEWRHKVPMDKDLDNDDDGDVLKTILEMTVDSITEPDGPSDTEPEADSGSSDTKEPSQIQKAKANQKMQHHHRYVPDYEFTTVESEDKDGTKTQNRKAVCPKWRVLDPFSPTRELRGTKNSIKNPQSQVAN